MRLAVLALPWLLIAAPATPDFTVVTVDVSDTPRRLDAADLDGDGDIDLLVVQSVDDDHAALQVLRNDSGQFTPGWSAVESAFTAQSSNIWDADLADTDNDGDVDVVYVVPFGSPRERFNDGQGQFGALIGIPTFSFKFENELEDMDGDGNVDLVYYEPDIFFDYYFGTMKGQGNGIFSWAEELALSSDIETRRRIALGDVTGDGLRDAAFTSMFSGLRLFRGLPPAPGSTLPGWAQPQLLYSKPCGDAVMADLDGNGHLDLVASVPPLDSVIVFLAGASGELIRPHRFPAGDFPEMIEAADFDLDGAPDIMVANPTTGQVHVLRGTGNGALEEPVGFHVGPEPTDLVAADLDGDGDIDLAVTCASAGHVALLFNETR